jgi:hypothetical protein
VISRKKAWRCLIPLDVYLPPEQAVSHQQLGPEPWHLPTELDTSPVSAPTIRQAAE